MRRFIFFFFIGTFSANLSSTFISIQVVGKLFTVTANVQEVNFEYPVVKLPVANMNITIASARDFLSIVFYNKKVIFYPGCIYFHAIRNTGRYHFFPKTESCLVRRWVRLEGIF